MANILKKTVVIGLGGTGMHAVLHMKKRLLNTYGKVPPMIKFLVIDTTDKDALETGEKQIELEAGEFLKIEVRQPGTLMKNPEIKNWIPDNIPKFALTSGAKQVRALGRLAVFANSSEIEAKITGLINSIRDFSIDRYNDNPDQPNNIVVNIVSSLAGGTGSGTFLDIAYLARENLGSTDKMIGYFLFPDIFEGKPATDNVAPNAFGAIKELNYFFTEGATYRYKLAGTERIIKEGLFNSVYLINNVNKHGIKYSDIDDLHEFIGMGLFLQSTSTGKKAGDIIDNLEAQLVGKRWFGKPTVFSSFGISELVYPGEWFADLYAKEIALNIIQKTFMGGDFSSVNEFTDDFIRRIGIKEHEADDVIDSILPPGDFKKFPLPSVSGKNIINEVFGRKEVHLNNLQKNIAATAKLRLAKLKDEKLTKLNSEIANRLSMPQGLEFSKNFLYALLGRLTDFKKEMMEERDENNKLKKDIEFSYPSVKSEAERGAKKLFGSKAVIENALKKFKGLVDRQANFIFEIERREKAIEFFACIINETRNWIEKLNDLSNYCNILTQELNQDIQQKQRERRKIKPFVMELKPEKLKTEIPKVDSHDFIMWLKNDKQMDVLQLAGMRINEVKDILLEYGYSLDMVKEVQNKRIYDILRELPQKKKTEIIGAMDRMASPLWQYDQGLITGDKTTQNIYLFGVENPSDTVITPEGIRNAISSPYEPAIIGIGDAKRIICFKIEAAVPAFVIKNMANYRDKYASTDKPFSYHIYKDWEKELPALFSNTE